MTSPPVADAARELGIELDQPESVNSDAARARIAAAGAEVVCVCAFGALIKEPLLSDYELLNVHPSLLPRWRGAAPIERAIIAGDERTGVSIMRMTAGLDSGPICAQAAEPIGSGDTYGSLSARLETLGGTLLLQALQARPTCADQDEAGATYADKLTADDRVLDPYRSAAELERRVRALNPHIGAALTLPDGGRLGVWEARAVDCGPLAPGEMGFDDPLLLGCSDGALELLAVQPPGRRAMSAAAYLRGRHS
jgi:methionyl-tRNA formyltransferase